MLAVPTPEHIDRIFEPFLTTKADGTGLGLFISHSIVQRHGGLLGVENLPDGRGVLFTLALPTTRESRVETPAR